MIHLYDFELSGNAHKARNLLSLLNVEHKLIPVDLGGGEHHRAPHLARNPFGQVPVLVDGDEVIRDSSAILVYLARKYGQGEWLPVDALGEARVQEWLATASTAVADGPGFARLIVLFGADGDLAEGQERARGVLAIFEAHLDGRSFLVGDRPTVADIANHSYIAMAPDGGVSLDAYPNVREWLERLEKLQGFVATPLRPEVA